MKKKTLPPQRQQQDEDSLTIADIIKGSAWANIKGIKAKDFIRDLESAKKGLTWQEAANFSGFETAKGVEKALGKVGIFHSRRNGRKFDIAAKLVPKDLQKGDHVIMWMLGCCTIMRIRKKNPNAAF